jgi:hypothetical protein
MGDRNKREISGHVFSPRYFYQQLVAGISKPDGSVPFEVTLKETGVTPLSSAAPGLSIEQIWLSGIYSESLKRQEFIDCLRAGVIPQPISDVNSAGLTERFIYTAPETLIRDSSTVTAAIGCSTSLLELALKSDRFVCTGCGDEIKKYTSTSEVISELASTFSGASISIHLESASDRLSIWAQNRGLKSIASDSGVYSVALDSGVCSKEQLISVRSLIHSAWKVPSPSLVCRRDSQETNVFSKNGHCSRCGIYFAPINRDILSKLFIEGARVEDTLAPIEQILVAPNLRLQDLLDKPISTLELPFEKSIDSALSILKDLGLSRISLGTKTEALSFREIAKLSVAASLIKSRKAQAQIIIALPSGVFCRDDADKIQATLRRVSTDKAIYLRDDLLGSATPDKDYSSVSSALKNEALSSSEKLDLTNSARPGGITHISNSENSFKYAVDSINQAISSNSLNLSVHPIPLFNAKKSSSTVIAHELRLFEPLTKLYAASLDARVHGLTHKDFAIFGSRSPRYVCRACRGLGVTITNHSDLPHPISIPCNICAGARCESTIGSCLFRGVPFTTILNRSIAESFEVLSALPKAKPILEIAKELDLLELPLGMPLNLLESSETRRLAIAAALIDARPAKPCVVIFEAPNVGLSQTHQTAIARLRDKGLTTKSLAWIEIG